MISSFRRGERGLLGKRGGKPREIQVYAAQKDRRRCRRRRLPPPPLQLCQYELINRVAHPGAVFHTGWLRTCQRTKGSVFLSSLLQWTYRGIGQLFRPDSPLIDPGRSDSISVGLRRSPTGGILILGSFPSMSAISRLPALLPGMIAGFPEAPPFSAYSLRSRRNPLM